MNAIGRHAAVLEESPGCLAVRLTGKKPWVLLCAGAVATPPMLFLASGVIASRQSNPLLAYLLVGVFGTLTAALDIHALRLSTLVYDLTMCRGMVEIRTRSIWGSGVQRLHGTDVRAEKVVDHYGARRHGLGPPIHRIAITSPQGSICFGASLPKPVQDWLVARMARVAEAWEHPEADGGIRAEQEPLGMRPNGASLGHASPLANPQQTAEPQNTE